MAKLRYAFVETGPLVEPVLRKELSGHSHPHPTRRGFSWKRELQGDEVVATGAQVVDRGGAFQR